jgi:hypothetical protein
MASRKKRWLVIALVVVAAGTTFVVWSLRNDDSTLSVLIRYGKQGLGLTDDSTVGSLLRRIAWYERWGRRDAALNAALKWQAKHPGSATDGIVDSIIASLYLEKARTDTKHANEYVDQAIAYRDKMLPSAQDNIGGLRQLEMITEFAGDLSARQRCTQYRNAEKLTERMVAMLEQEASNNQLDILRRQADQAKARIQGKLMGSGCQAG